MHAVRGVMGVQIAGVGTISGQSSARDRRRMADDGRDTCRVRHTAAAVQQFMGMVITERRSRRAVQSSGEPPVIGRAPSLRRIPNLP